MQFGLFRNFVNEILIETSFQLYLAAYTDPLFKELKLLKVMDIFKTQCLKFFKRLNTGQLPNYFLSNFKFSRSCDVHNRPLRNTNVYRREHTNRHLSRNSIRHYIPSLLNETDRSLISYMQSHSILSAKKKIKIHYLGFYKMQCDKALCYVCGRWSNFCQTFFYPQIELFVCHYGWHHYRIHFLFQTTPYHAFIHFSTISFHQLTMLIPLSSHFHLTIIHHPPVYQYSLVFLLFLYSTW